MTCLACEKRAGVYDFHCLACCARLVADSRPNRLKQETMLAVLEKFPASPTRDAILETLKQKPI